MANLPIDLDLESVQYDGVWYTRDELAKKIKSQLEAGDYQISRPSQALELLTSQLQSAKTLSFKVPLELADALNAAAAKQGRSAAAILRDAVSQALSVREPVGRRTTEPEMPAIPPPPLAPPGLNPVHPPVLAGPGALKSAAIIDSNVTADEAAKAVDLKPKKKEEEAVERRWFGG